MSSLFYNALSVVLGLSLVGCGGGDSSINSTPTTTITEANQTFIAAEVSTNALQFTGNLLGSVALVAFGTDEKTPQTLASQNVRLIVSDIPQMIRQNAQAVVPQALSDGIVVSITGNQNCAGGGTKKTIFDDKNGNQQWDVYETGTATFFNCTLQVIGGVTLNGVVNDEFLLDSLTTTTDKLTFKNLKISNSSGAAVELVSGTVVYSETITGNIQNLSLKSTDQFVTQNLTVKVTATNQLASFILNEDVSFSQSAPNLNLKTISGNGVIDSDNINFKGAVKFDITTPIVVSVTEPVSVSAGQMVITGSGDTDTVLYVSFATPNTSSATLQLKKDGVNVGNPKVVSASGWLSGVSTTSAVTP